MTVYAADKLVPRKSADDRWTRTFVIHHPVASPHRWRRVKRVLEGALGFLTGDSWTLQCRKRQVAERDEGDVRTRDYEVDRVVLCSGGLDSLVGAIECAAAGEYLCLVGHHGGGQTPQFQHAVMTSLAECYHNSILTESFQILPPRVIGEGEPTMRSRSLLFIALGIAVANVLREHAPLSIPENGLITLNVPLTGPRNGSASTRTTHPYFINQVSDVLAQLQIPHSLELPYRFHTKGEMLSTVDGDLLRKLLPETMSCSHPELGRWAKQAPGLHCGYCVPCMIRRAAIRHAGLERYDAVYRYDIFDNSCRLTGDTHRDLRAVQTALMRLRAQPVSRDVFTVQDSGPLPPDHIRPYADVYRRGMRELANMFEVDI